MTAKKTFSVPLCSPHVTEAECEAARKVILSGWMTHGPQNGLLEERFRGHLGVSHALCVNSCTSALFLAVQASGLRGEIILPSFTFPASANAIVTAGATPVFADIDYDTCCIDPESLKRCLTPRTEAIMVVHFAGQACPMDPIVDIARARNLTIIEDCAETLGGAYKGHPAGSFGIGCFSFFPTKNITTGEGGVLASDDAAFMARAKNLAAHGIASSTLARQQGDSTQAPWHREAIGFGYNFRMSNVLAAIGVVQFDKLEEMNRLRREHARCLIEGLKGEDRIDLPIERADCEHVYQMFTIKLRNAARRSRDAFVWKLREAGIEASVHFDPPLHLQRLYSDFRRDDLTVTEKAAQSILTLPLFPGMSRRMLDRIISTVKRTLSTL